MPLKSPLAAVQDAAAAWDDLTYLAAAQTDLAVFQLWRSSDERSRGPRPDPLPRPGQEPRSESRTTYDLEGMSFDEADEWLKQLLARGGD